MLDGPRECYRILDVEPGASLEEVKRSYRELVKVWHPDRFANDPSLQAKAQEKLKQINLAYERICKGEPADSSGRTTTASPHSTGGEQQRGPSNSQESKRQASENPPPPRPEPSQAEVNQNRPPHQPGTEAQWSYAAIGFGFLALTLWLAPTLTDDFAKYEAGEGIRTTRKMFLLYQLFGKQGVVAFFLVFGFTMGYVGLCHARALLSGQSLIRFGLKKGHLITAAVILGFFVLTGDRPQRRGSRVQPAYTQSNPAYPAQTPSVVQPTPDTQFAPRQATASPASLGFENRDAALIPAPAQTPDSDTSRDSTADGPKKMEMALAKPRDSGLAPNNAYKDFFTVGSTKETVVAIHGEPTRFDSSFLAYGSSMVWLSGGKVSNWTQGDVKLKARFWTATNVSAKELFTVGSTKEEVMAIHGEPTRFDYSFLAYGSSMVWLSGGKVSNWTEGDVKLKARFWTATDVSAKEFFTVGSTKEEVMAIHGEPTRFDYSFLAYGSSMVWLSGSKVSNWTQGDVKLKARFWTPTNMLAKEFFTVGSTKEEVMAIHGEPTRFDYSFLAYGSSMVWLSGGKVSNWTEGDVKLKARFWTATNTPPKAFFTIGSTRDEVMAIHGEPTRFDSSFLAYGRSMVWLSAGKVSNWTEGDVKLKARLTNSKPD